MKHHVIVNDGVVVSRGYIVDPTTTKAMAPLGHQIIEIDDPSIVEIGHIAKKTKSSWSFTAPKP